MKKSALLCLISLMFAFSLLAQDIKYIDLDFMALPPEYNINLHYKSNVAIRIKNINRNIYKIDGVKTETDYNTALPSALTGIKLPVYLYTSMPQQAMLAASAEGKSPTGVADILNEIKKLLGLINENAYRLDQSTLLYNELVHLSKNCTDKPDLIIGKLLSKGNEYMNHNDSIGQIPNNLEDYLNNLIGKSISALSQLTADVDKIESTAFEGLETTHKFDVEQMNDAQEGYQDALMRKLSKDEQSKAKNQYLSFKEKVDGYSEDQKSLNTAIDQIKQNLTKAQSLVEDMRKFKRDDKIYSLVHLVQVLINPATFRYTSETMNLKTDEVKYAITIEPTELNICDIGGKKIVNVTVKIEGGFKIDFSTGVFVNGGSADFLGRSYYYQNIDANTRQIITADRGSRSMLSVGALMHLYRRSPSNIKLAGSAGVSLSSGLTDLNFHVGPSLIIGNQNRIILTTGLTLKSSPLLDQKLAINMPYTKLQSPDAIPTVSMFPIGGWFIALTYNFTSLLKK